MKLKEYIDKRIKSLILMEGIMSNIDILVKKSKSYQQFVSLIKAEYPELFTGNKAEDNKLMIWIKGLYDGRT